ncbi:MAG: prepilin-type N-terminal cleavage/methylation domain-containing protein [Gemmatimonadota bacterium]
MVARRRAGFTLVEAMVALTISSILVVLVSTVFLAQNRYYALQISRSAAHDNARVMTEVMAGELRSVARGGFVVARDTLLEVRSPMTVAAVCAQPATSRVAVQYSGGEGFLDTDEFGGFAVQDTLTDAWSYYDITGWNNVWNAIDQNGKQGAKDCAANGADTVGAVDEFQRLRRLDTYAGSLPAVGQLVMLYRRVEYVITTSKMDSTSLGLFRGIFGADPVEVATGLDASARFQYRAGGSTYVSPVTGSGLGDIDAVRIVADARTRPRAGATDDVTFGWSVNVYLRNGR